ncbi:odorant receptor 13a-like [Bombus huntii]|uniref:odorant receptor 13a-like n=1 Tax=Bombus huntii TaxID=85661 RepID=UPI0021AA0C8A|nr:odorant receptor 13a-like [Bombus huntii]
MCNTNDCAEFYEVSEKSSYSIHRYGKLRTYIQQHQALTDFCKKLEDVFNLIVLGQVSLFSLLICLDGYLILMDDAPATRRFTFAFHITGCMCQLLMFTYSCDCLIRDSANVANAAYKSLWSRLPMDQFGKILRKDLILVIMRSATPSCLTACGFFTVSLETYTGTCLYNVCNILAVLMPLLKMTVLLAHKQELFHLITYTQRKFWHENYDENEKRIYIDCKRKCTVFVCFVIFTTKATLICYALSPIIENIGRNESAREFLFNMWIDLPLTMSPYYEMTFMLQLLTLYHIGVGYFCFDNLLCVMNLHLATQFQILQYKMSRMTDLTNKEKGETNPQLFSGSSTKKYYTVFKKYVQQHQALISYCGKLESVFNLPVLAQVLTFSLVMCLDGYQILMPGAPTRTRFIFSFQLIACLCQLLMFTYSCDCIMQESTSVALAVYKGPWSFLPATESGMMMRKDLILVTIRSGVPCCITGYGFFIVSLETYTRVLSTAVSYFTLLRQTTQETLNS